MKIAAMVLAVLVLLASLGYVLFFMEDQPVVNPAGPGQAASASQSVTGTGRRSASAPGIGERTDADLFESIEAAYEENPDAVGWLTIPGTDIDDVVLQSHDNLYYLRLNEEREYDVYGCYFADYVCSFGPREMLSANTVIYGHSDLKDNPDGKRFSQLFRFTEPEFAKATPYLEFSTDAERMHWQVFAVFYTDVEMNYIETELSGPELVGLADEAKQKSIYDYGVPVEEGDNILTLSTCTIKFGADDTDHRFVVMAKLVPADETLSQRADITIK